MDDKKKFTILNVDDNETSRYALTRIMRQAGFKVIEAATGNEALQKLVEKPDLVLLDVNLPDISGFEVCKKIKGSPATTHILVLHLSATYLDSQSKVIGLEGGAEGYLTYPVEPPVLIATIKALLRMREAEQKVVDLAKFPEENPNPVLRVSRQGKILYANEAAFPLLAEWGSGIGKSMPDKCREAVIQAYETKQNREEECRCKDRIFSFIIAPIPGADYVNLYAIDVTKRKKVEDELQKYRAHLEELVKERTLELAEANEQLKVEIHERSLMAKDLFESKEKYKILVEGLPHRVFHKDKNSVYVACSYNLAHDLKILPSQIRGKTDYDFFPQDLAEKYRADDQRVMEAGKMQIIEEEYIHDDQRVLVETIKTPLKDEKGDVVGLLGIFIDISARKKMEEELQKMDKLEAVGVLAGGIAHDFNNMLTSILGNISLAELYIQPGDSAYDALIRAKNASKHSARLTKQLLTFSKGGAPIRETASISEMIKETVGFATRGSKVSCEYSLADNLWMVEIDKGQISQVINNLIINAEQAMPGGGVIKIFTENVTLRGYEKLPLKEGKYLRIVVKDQGAGISEEDLTKIFDPYFTTKEEGSGLGLATCYSIVRNHEGYLAVESEVGFGTTFSVYLPASAREILEVKEVREEKLYFGHGRILFMDDEQDLIDTAKKMLLQLGYEVKIAKNGSEAIELYKDAKDFGQPFDAVILDLTIPGGMGGKEVIKKLKKINPEIKAVVSSGYSNDQVMSKYRQFGFSGMVSKPYEIKNLSQELYRVLSGSKEIQDFSPSGNF